MTNNKFALVNLVLAATLFAALPAVAAHQDTSITSATEVHDEASGVAAIKAKFTGDTLLSPLNIDVTMKGKTALLKGQVDTEMQYDRAVSLASSIKGIDEVEAQDLKVKNSTHPMDDMLITAKVKGALLKEAVVHDVNTEAWPFKIETKDGVVFIKGVAKNEQVKINALKTIQAVKGVKSIKDDVTIKADK